MVIMESVTLSSATPSQCEVKAQKIFPNKQGTALGKRDFSVVANQAVEIAEKLNASAIITFSEDIPKVATRIPLIVFTGRISTMMNEITRHIEETDKTIYDKIEDRARGVVKDINDACVVAYINNLLETGGLVVGVTRMMDNDSIIVYDLSTNKVIKKLLECTERVDANVLRSVLNIAIQIACQGREGKPFGTAFIVGDSNEVMRRSHALVLNPFEGQPNSCSIVNPESWETVKSFAQLDGVFVITGKGIIRAAGRYLDINAKDMPVEKGLGGRHTSAAAITRDTETIAITVSSSGGTIRVFKDGLEVVKIEPDIMLVQ